MDFEPERKEEKKEIWKLKEQHLIRHLGGNMSIPPKILSVADILQLSWRKLFVFELDIKYFW